MVYLNLKKLNDQLNSASNKMTLYKKSADETDTTIETEDESRVLKNCVFSTEDIDGDGEIIRQAGWDLKRFIKNPVILPQHRRSAEPVGKCTRIEVKNKQLVGDIEFADTDEGQVYYKLYKDKIMRGFSVGYRAKKKATMDENASPYWGPFEYLEQELLEISCVSIPCNENALAEVKSIVNEETADMMIKSFSEDTTKTLTEENIRQIAKIEVLEAIKGLFSEEQEQVPVNSQPEYRTTEKSDNNYKEENKPTEKDYSKMSIEEFALEPEIVEFVKQLPENTTDEEVLEQVCKVYLEITKNN